MGSQSHLHDPVARFVPELGGRLEAMAEGRALTDLRERDLARALKEAVGSSFDPEAIDSGVLRLSDWPSMGGGGSDFVLRETPSGLPLHVAELKWCQVGDDKVYEAVWDVFKLALARATIASVQTTHLITGAPADMWGHAFCRDLFEGGDFDSAELCQRIDPRSSSGRTAWDYLLDGGYDRWPERVPAVITTTPAGEAAVGDGISGGWVIRAVEVVPLPEAGMVEFDEGWPRGERPASARRPAL